MKQKLLPFILIVISFQITAQLSGVVNSYAEVTGITLNTVTVPSNASFNIGDRILLIQMKGATINLTNTSAYGTVSSLNNAGNYEFLTVLSKAGLTTITFTSSIVRAYTVGGSNRVQIVRVRTITTNTSVTGNVNATAWDGFTGGVIAIEVIGSLTINAGFRIDASGQGFRGGAVSAVSDNVAWCNWSDFRSTNITSACYQGIYAQKGEGIAEDIGNDYARGALANGGGGSGEHNGGGGGGANIAVGGDGGRQLSGCANRRNNTGMNCNTPVGGAVQSSICSPSLVASTNDVMVGGIGGRALPSGSVNSKIFMGGGGGGGQQNGIGGSSGAIGGGIIIVYSSSIINNSGFADAIRSEGNTAANTTGNEGAGGGGGGGAILLQTSNFNNAITLSVKGGNGGNAITNNTVCRGPGGGGGGGLIMINGLSTTPVNLTTNILSGTAGSVACSNPAACGGAPATSTSLTCLGNLLYCAQTPPSNGIVEANLNLPLPIELINFNTECKKTYTSIIWSTASETFMDYFIVQKSNDALTWIDLGTVASHAPSSVLQHYSIQDYSKNNNDSYSYYRLKQLNSDNTVNYTHIIPSYCLANSSYDFNIYYNQNTELVFKTLPNKLTIYNAMGQLVKNIDLEGEFKFTLQKNSLAKAIYLVVAEFEKTTVSKKIVILD